MSDPRSFGAWLRRERERRAITLRAIADRTKIGAGLLEALERGDVSRWPGGIYRRAFVRSYAESIGLDPDLVVANFERVFPPDPSVPAPAPAAPAAERAPEGNMRLSLAAPGVAGVSAAQWRKAAVDLALVAVFALAGLVAAGAIGFWTGAAVSSLVCHLMRVLGPGRLGARPQARGNASPGVSPRADVLSFETQGARSSRRARARRVLADLSAAATSGTLPGRRRAARS